MMLTRNGLILAATLLAGMASAEVVHTSKATNLKVSRESSTYAGSRLMTDALLIDPQRLIHIIQTLR